MTAASRAVVGTVPGAASDPHGNGSNSSLRVKRHLGFGH